MHHSYIELLSTVNVGRIYMYVLLFISGLPNQSKSEVPTRRSRSASQWGMMGNWLRMGIWLRMRTRRCFTWNFRRECFTVESPTQTLYDKFLSMIFVHLGQKKLKNFNMVASQAQPWHVKCCSILYHQGITQFFINIFKIWTLRYLFLFSNLA